ncbi:BirA family transcriptional regulator, biotin operon repressor / biotin-[acetyl-CoA-carboxylase] ligase [Lutibacter agarilyticus]|uniref:biotin--[biotin carboxyl-carrier protein] ligase n=2 Tax=Lutibacter agarilyticus TaxID=1109740 RepID=A0A238XX84_9FLAO|nr:BirA family transcriptional regulator, biotin operon repressor / biotin-[acetyl-CoA-carboxylase] ligase [Lutibacter agarilyticus]
MLNISIYFMHIIKLSAIDSTNSYLKNLCVGELPENFTVIAAEHQLLGRGQMGATWESVSGKNLTFSVLVRFSDLHITDQFYLSMAVALAILKVLKGYVKNKLFVKWPNDILADKSKLAGILIENVLGRHAIKYAVIGVGLNVNQENFSNEIKNVTSLKKLAGEHIQRDELLIDLINSLKKYVKLVENQGFFDLKKEYIANLFKYEVPSMFEDYLGNQFLGKIIDISADGRLVVELENEKTRKFNLKEIKFASF